MPDDPTIAHDPFASDVQKAHNLPLQQGGVTAEEVFELQKLSPSPVVASIPEDPQTLPVEPPTTEVVTD